MSYTEYLFQLCDDSREWPSKLESPPLRERDFNPVLFEEMTG